MEYPVNTSPPFCKCTAAICVQRPAKKLTVAKPRVSFCQLKRKEIKSEYYQHGVTDQYSASVIVRNENWDTSNLTIPEHTRLVFSLCAFQQEQGSTPVVSAKHSVYMFYILNAK